jgi:hypothetical protein
VQRILLDPHSPLLAEQISRTHPASSIIFYSVESRALAWLQTMIYSIEVRYARQCVRERYATLQCLTHMGFSRDVVCLVVRALMREQDVRTRCFEMVAFAERLVRPNLHGRHDFQLLSLCSTTAAAAVERPVKRVRRSTFYVSYTAEEAESQCLQDHAE